MILWREVDKVSKAHQNWIALSYGNHAMTYQEVMDKANKLSALFEEHKVGKGHVIVCYTGNVPAFLTTLLAVSKVGSIFLPLDPNLKENEKKAILAPFNDQFHLVFHKSLPLENDRFLSRIELEENGSIADTQMNGVSSFSELSSIGMIQFSSGSTGTPKGILLNHEAMYHRANNLRISLKLTSTDKTLCAVPLSHSHGIDCLALPTLLSGGSLYIYPPELAAPTSILNFIDKKKITFFSSVPSFYELCLKLIKSSSFSLASLRLPFCGSAALHLKTAEDFYKNFNVPIKQGYGLAEIGVICLNMHEEEPISYSSVGKVIEGVTSEVIDGELVVSGKALYSGYLSQDMKIIPVPEKLVTGDLVQKDEFERFYIVGRKKDFINVSGLKVYPLEVEAIIKENLHVKECAVLADQDPLTGERVIAFVETLNKTDDYEAIGDELLKHLRSKLSDYKVPKKLIFVETFAKSPLGKVLKNKLRFEDALSTYPQ